MKIRDVELNLTKETAEFFIDWLGKDPNCSHMLTDFDAIWQHKEVTNFIINNHSLLNYSNQVHEVIIDYCYCPAGGNYCAVVVDNKEYTPVEYCMMKLGFE